MTKIYLSDSGPKVSQAIYGFWRWEDVSSTGVVTMEKIVNYCLELGINTFDHADIYGDYQCEALFGNLMAKKSFKREDVVLFSKCGLRVPSSSHPDVRIPHYNTCSDHITKSVEQSLRNFRTDY